MVGELSGVPKVFSWCHQIPRIWIMEVLRDRLGQKTLWGLCFRMHLSENSSIGNLQLVIYLIYRRSRCQVRSNITTRATGIGTGNPEDITLDHTRFRSKHNILLDLFCLGKPGLPFRLSSQACQKSAWAAPMANLHLSQNSYVQVKKDFDTERNDQPWLAQRQGGRVRQQVLLDLALSKVPKHRLSFHCCLFPQLLLVPGHWCHLTKSGLAAISYEIEPTLPPSPQSSSARPRVNPRPPIACDTEGLCVRFFCGNQLYS